MKELNKKGKSGETVGGGGAGGAQGGIRRGIGVSLRGVLCLRGATDAVLVYFFFLSLFIMNQSESQR
jgi:hypothetical protein